MPLQVAAMMMTMRMRMRMIDHRGGASLTAGLNPESGPGNEASVEV